MPSRLDPVPLEPVGQGGRVAEAEQLGGAGLVSGGGVQGPLQVVSRNPVDEAIEINALLYVLAEDLVLIAGGPGSGLGGRSRASRASSASMVSPAVQTAARRRVLSISRTLPGQGWSIRSFLAATESFLWLVARLGLALAVDLIQEAVEQQAGVALALAERRQVDDGDGEPVEQVLAEAAGGDLGGQGAVGGGEDADIDPGRGCGADAGDLALLEGAQQLDLGGLGQLADLVQKERAGVGGLEVAPALGAAPVKAPFSWPNSSDSTRSGAMAPQLTVTKGRSRRGLAWWMARARSSLPVPDSPSIRTGMERGATRRARAMTRCMTGLRWTMAENSGASGGRPAARRSSSRSGRASRSGRKSAAMSKGTDAVRTPCWMEDSISSAGKRVLARMIQTAAMAGVPGLEMEGEPVVRLLAGNGLRDDLPSILVDGAEVGGAVQGDVVRGDGGLGQALQPGEIGRGLGLGLVADQLQPGESSGLQGLGDGSEADLVAFGDGAQVGPAEPTDEDGSHGSGA